MIKGNKKNNYRNIFDSAVSTSAFRNKTYQGGKILKLLLADVYQGMGINAIPFLCSFCIIDVYVAKAEFLETEIEL